MVAHRFGHLPRRGESTTVDRFQFNVQRADSRRVHLFQVAVLPDSGSTEA
ncbi:MAG: transporter associated domain-containing protein [Nevskiales bacterium]